jgi:threonine dehydrogenase-like Zn-dependent dehydrogenase
MRAAVFHEPGRVEAGERPDPVLREPTDAIVRVLLACVCGSDLWYYRPADAGLRDDGRGGFRTCDLSRVKRALSH